MQSIAMADAIRQGDLQAFFQTPFEVYRDTHYVSPMKSDLLRMLDPNANPLFAHPDDLGVFTCHRQGRPLGRITAHVHRASNSAFGQNAASFGFFDCADDADVARTLLEAAETWARNRGFDQISGNFNLTAMQQLGVQTDGFNRAGYTDMIVNPPHIPAHLSRNGYARRFPVTTFELDLATARVPERDLPPGLRFAPVTKRTFDRRMEDARAVLNDGFADNPMFVPLSQDAFLFQAGEMTTILDPRLSTVVLRGDRPVGVAICIPDLNGLLRATRSRFGVLTPFHFLRYRLTRRRAVIIFYSVARDHHGQGIMSAVIGRTLQGLRSAGYRHLGITWIADENAGSLRMMEKIGAEPLHRLHLFGKDLR